MDAPRIHCGCSETTNHLLTPQICANDAQLMKIGLGATSEQSEEGNGCAAINMELQALRKSVKVGAC